MAAKPYFTPHAARRYYERLGIHADLETQSDIVARIRAGECEVLEKQDKGWTVKCALHHKHHRLIVIYDHRRKQVTTLWVNKEPL